MAFCDNAIALFDDCAKMAVSHWSREWERGISGHVGLWPSGLMPVAKLFIGLLFSHIFLANLSCQRFDKFG